MTDEYKIYCCEYQFDGSTWGIDIPARSFEEAQARLKIMPWGKVLGELHMTIPASVPAAGLFVRIVCWFKNTFKTSNRT